jgi:hypothetical protein
VTLGMGSVSFGLFAATASAQAPGSSPTVTGTATAGAGGAAATVTTGSSAAPAPVARTVAPGSAAPTGASDPAVQVIAGNHSGPCSPITAQQVTGANTAQVAVTNDSGNGIGNIGNGNGRGSGTTQNLNSTSINQNVSISCFNNTAPQTVTKTVVVPQTVTKTVVVPQTKTVVVQQAPVASAVTTTAHFTG